MRLTRMEGNGGVHEAEGVSGRKQVRGGTKKDGK